MKLAVLASGAGSILQSIVEHGIEVALVVVDRPCPATELAAELGLEWAMVERTDFGAGFDRDVYSKALVDVLGATSIDVVAMAGFGTIMSEPFFRAFPDRVLNTHPALLPSFKGWHAVRDALAAGVKITGCTVHIATEEVDAGPILAQAAVEVRADDDEATLHERIKRVERELYPTTIVTFLEHLEATT